MAMLNKTDMGNIPSSVSSKRSFRQIIKTSLNIMIHSKLKVSSDSGSQVYRPVRSLSFKVEAGRKTDTNAMLMLSVGTVRPHEFVFRSYAQLVTFSVLYC